MVRNTLALLLLTLLWIPLARGETFVASVDRTTLNQDEVVELTLRSDKQQFFSTPDLSPLEEHFTIVSQLQSSQFQSNNGKSVSWTDWVIKLSPKRAGFVVIPPIVLDGLATDPISLQIEKPSTSPAPKQPGAVEPIFMEGSVDLERVYVQQQILYTLRIMHSVPLFDDSKLSELKIDNAIVQSLGQPTARSEIINGVRHGIFELQYAIYPQSSGSIVIPSQQFTATAVNNRDPFNPYSGRAGKRISIRSAEIHIDVKAAPPEWDGKHWLPARALELDQQWSGDPNQLTVGDSITRTLNLKVDGLTFAQLPPIEPSEITGLNAYPDQPRNENRLSDHGIMGITTLSSAFVATQPGDYRLPALSIEWFDIESGELRKETLDEQQITVLPAVTTPVAEPNQPQPLSPEKTVPIEQPAAIVIQNESKPDNYFWQLLSALLLLLWLLTALWGWRRTTKRTEESKSESLPDHNESSAYDALLNHCKSGEDPHNFAPLLRSWLTYLLKAPAGIPVEELCQQAGSHQLKALFAHHENSLYNNSNKSPPDYKSHIPVLEQVRNAHLNSQQQETLKPLYG
ncbi:BatD family protein [Aestuariirhabdus sp. Z084]|uniref:BatD family protein n=1 Tax=Aestuariirhabdus haliotis TaxID=2918751 RepID=UPI00201B43C3|nr:BatD family protein [Aestuariirhabdus haliotis]MCL6414614.1 BatD family protein [Aestuariirhabdus haliotis]MCL6418404.1 BatD family protein [Aestuariirhabdus haliotis]